MRWSALPTKAKASVVVAIAAVIWVGGVGTAGAVVGAAVTSASQDSASPRAVADVATTPTPIATPTPTPTPTPVVEVSEVSKDFPIHFRKTTIDDPTLAKGQTRLQTAGVDGVLTRTYRVTTTDGVETDRVQVSRTVSTAPVPEVTAVGSYVEPAPAPAPAPAAPAPAPVEQAPAPSQDFITPGAFCADAQAGVVAQAANGNSYTCGGKGPDANGHLHWNVM
ncbi:G5 domain-containing protein [Curtobacterium flaccumfaciens]|uniref:G5 domain-containing protein n=1 Tax=Curtobacterium flaccumfaciens TaxID=2035 RepID=UPI000FFF5AB2|nr:G5 domain-containing protein [Curtobacterium flaccumfaciens]MCS0646651.1 G5 domain-containing protein [Curtobacterium flaccumfaciens pv. flaccumfaciens]MCS6525974.1 G5 domain-containing protein [Curtobacterium flaccumfaciens pv. flaccumfaciens]MCS6528671.1 G5 domain-containing protein [Curtobacterium flaccumfaciens pv. flaccumfaciens]NUU11422.1 hypothetical protein [Curtobacterium flaccumfaciens]RXF86082.1 hypothetical protein CffCFBP3418_00320 [Curtobacterium flaccumfaciens pv. flaccumfaci